MKLSTRIGTIEPSATLSLNAKVKELTAEGRTIHNFTAGEPDFNTPANVQEAAVRAMKSGYTKYTAVSGAPELRQAISAKLKRENELSYGPSEIIVSNGGKHALFNALSAMCNPGDSVIIPAPYWVSYPEMVKLTEATPVIAQTEKDACFRITAEHISEIAGPKAKALILNSPSNPTGSVYTRKELNGIAKVAVEKDFFVISDEIYEHLVYGDEHVSIASMKGMKERTIIVNGASKSYAMTGWRLGWAAGPEDLIKLMTGFQSHTTSGPSSISQMAYKEALEGDQSSLAVMRKKFNKRRNLIVDMLNSIPGVDCPVPGGAFYVFPEVRDTRGFSTSEKFSMKLLDKAGVAVVPGSAFGAEGHVRISYACSEETIRKGIEAMKKYLS